MTRPFITFDCYGTLIDWEVGIIEAFREAAAAEGVSLDPAAVLPALFDTRPAAEAPEYRTYRDRLTDAAVRVGERLGWRMTAADGARDVAGAERPGRCRRQCPRGAPGRPTLAACA